MFVGFKQAFLLFLKIEHANIPFVVIYSFDCTSQSNLFSNVYII